MKQNESSMVNELFQTVFFIYVHFHLIPFLFNVKSKNSRTFKTIFPRPMPLLFVNSILLSEQKIVHTFNTQKINN